RKAFGFTLTSSDAPLELGEITSIGRLDSFNSLVLVNPAERPARAMPVEIDASLGERALRLLQLTERWPVLLRIAPAVEQRAPAIHAPAAELVGMAVEILQQVEMDRDDQDRDGEIEAEQRQLDAQQRQRHADIRQQQLCIRGARYGDQDIQGEQQP